MSDTDSFIDEVTEEVRRDRLFATMKKYGWIAVLAVLLLVGGAGFNEWRKAQARAEAEATGDAMVAALRVENAAARAKALSELAPGSEGAKAVAALLSASGAQEAEDAKAAASALQEVSDNSDLPLIYRQVAAFKLLALRRDEMSTEERRAGYEALVGPASGMRLLAEEQLALLDIDEGKSEDAGKRLAAIAADAEATAGLRQRATQLMVAIGVEPEELLKAIAGGAAAATE